MARNRNAMLACLCALAALAFIPGPAASATPRAQAAAHHSARGHRARCATRRHARRASFRFLAKGRHTAGWRCLRHHRGARRLHRARHTSRRHTAARSSACVDADLTPTQWNLDRIRAATLCLVNRERAGQGEGPLTPDATLERAAQAHTEDMALGDYFDHAGRRGDTPASRMRAYGYIYSSRIGYEIGENIGWGTLWLATPRAIVAAWMASPGHRANIVDGRYRDTAIGVSPHPLASMAHSQPGAIYTQDFGVTFGG